MSSTPPQEQNIVRAAIHPAIGISRVGDSPREWFLGAEVPDAPPPEGGYRDSNGRLKREAARFRIYGYNADNEVIKELTLKDADIQWHVHVANEKAAWYEWQLALDIPVAVSVNVPLRNKNVSERSRLKIDSGLQSVTGPSQTGPVLEGQFEGQNVKMGELLTDESGRLIFLPGHGISGSPTNQPIYQEDLENPFINAAGWYDDICDGPVTADVTLDGQKLPVEGAWVISAPPNFAPGIEGLRTLYDLLFDLFVEKQWLPAIQSISFKSDILPILHRLSRLQWVNKGFAVQYGKGGPFPFEDSEFITRLARTDSLYQELRQQIFNSFRLPDTEDGNQLAWPWVYGDGMKIPADTKSPYQNAPISGQQAKALSQWVAGDFENDLDSPYHDRHATIEEFELTRQPEILDRAALDHCLADAFHPGCEVTWTIRHISIFSAPFRIRHKTENSTEPDYGPVLNQQIALGPNGPLHEQGPGGLTRWMGLPWQADTAFCRSGYDAAYDPYVPTFWPARVPNQVLLQEDYEIAIDENYSREERLRAFMNRYNWVDPIIIDSGTMQREDIGGTMMEMVEKYGSMGLLVSCAGLPGDFDLPETIYVASFGPDLPIPFPPPEVSAEAGLETTDSTPVSWENPDVRKSAPLPVKIPKFYHQD